MGVSWSMTLACFCAAGEGHIMAVMAVLTVLFFAKCCQFNKNQASWPTCVAFMGSFGRATKQMALSSLCRVCFVKIARLLSFFKSTQWHTLRLKYHTNFFLYKSSWMILNVLCSKAKHQANSSTRMQTAQLRNILGKPKHNTTSISSILNLILRLWSLGVRSEVSSSYSSKVMRITSSNSQHSNFNIINIVQSVVTEARHSASKTMPSGRTDVSFQRWSTTVAASIIAWQTLSYKSSSFQKTWPSWNIFLEINLAFGSYPWFSSGISCISDQVWLQHEFPKAAIGTWKLDQSTELLQIFQWAQPQGDWPNKRFYRWLHTK